MKGFAVLVAAAFAGLANAQSQCLTSAMAIPSCGQACLISAGSSAGCSSTDFSCQCSHQSQINNAQLTSCVLSACSSSVPVALMVSSSAEALCSCVSANGGKAGTTAAASSSVPATTNAISVTGAAPAATSAAKQTSAANVPMQTAGTATSKVSMFTGGAAVAAGSTGGLLAAFMGIVALL